MRGFIIDRDNASCRNCGQTLPQRGHSTGDRTCTEPAAGLRCGCLKILDAVPDHLRGFDIGAGEDSNRIGPLGGL